MDDPAAAPGPGSRAGRDLGPGARPERRLAAILVMDVAGYSRLMEADERRTLERLTAHRRQLVEPLVAEHRGRVVKLMGDGALCEFASAVDAVECAALIQEGMTGREADVPEEQRIRFRIGINLGDVIREADGDLYGDGVNIAARLEQLALPGGICVSRTVYDHARGKVAVAFRALGPQRVKNISQAVEAYSLDLAGVPLRQRRKRRGPGTLAAAGLLLLALVAGGWWLREQWLGGGPAPLPGRPSIAVLAFDNLSGDPTQDYFSDGIAEEILTALGRSAHLTVIARNSSFAYKGRAADVKAVGRELGVRYLLEGSVKRDSDRVRVTAQLADARTGDQVWAERYDRPLGDIFALQDEIAAATAARLGATIERTEAELARRKAPSDLGAYDYYLQGRAKRLTNVKAQTLEARELFRHAIALDPDFAPAYAELAHSYYTELSLRWNPAHRDEALSEGLLLGRKAVELDPGLPLAHVTVGNLLMRRHDYDEAVQWAERAIALDPNDPENYSGLANIYSFIGRAGDAVTLMRKAVELDPSYPPRYGMYLGRAYLLARQPEAAVPPLRNAASLAPDYWPAQLFLAAAYGHLGRNDDAGTALAAAQKYGGFVTMTDFVSLNDYEAGPEKDYLVEGLARAGMRPR